MSWGIVATIGGTILSGVLGSKENKKSAAPSAANTPGFYDPYAQYRPAAAQQLDALMKDPSLAQKSPVYDAMFQAAQRQSASQGYNGSGNALVAAANAGGQAYQQDFNDLAMLSGANSSPAQAGALAASQGNYNQQMNQQMWGGLGGIFGRLGSSLGNAFGGGGGGDAGGLVGVPMDSLMSGLMGATSFGTGVIQGQDQYQQHQIQMQQLAQQGQAQQMALLMNGMKLQDEQKNLGYQQDEAAYARQLATDPDTMDLPIDQKMDLLTKNALSKGDLVRANEFAVNATNFRNTQVLQDQKKMAIARGTMETQQKLHQYMGSELAAAAEGGPEEFNKAKLLALSSGSGTPEDQQNLASLEWDPDLARRLRLGAMTSRQQAQTLQATSDAAQKKKNQDFLERNREINQGLHTRAQELRERTAADKAKAGNVPKAPTTGELEQAVPYLKDLKDQGLSPSDLAQAQQDLVGMAKSIRTTNPNISLAQAFQQAAVQLPKNVQHITIPGTFKDTTKVTYKMPGATAKDPIPFTGDKSSLIIGRHYTYHNKMTGQVETGQWSGTGFTPEQ